MTLLVRLLIFSFSLFSFSKSAQAQVIAVDTTQKNTLAKANEDSSLVKIASIKITGNRHTKGYIILREIQFKAGDFLQRNKLAENFKQARTQVYNTNLFIEVNMDSTVIDSNTIQVNVEVKERWYIFPAPQFSLIDRSYKEWIQTFNADFNRVVYGLNFKHYNFSGRRDQLGITILNGYARNLSFNYNSPYSNNKLTRGYSISAGITQNREIGYKTSYENKPLVYTNTGFIRNNYHVDASYSWRNAFFRTTGISVGLNYTIVDDSVVNSKYNPNYFSSEKVKQFIPDFNFGIGYSNTDKNAYPLKGLQYNYGISKRGFGITGGINSTTLYGSYSKYIAHSHNFFSSIKASSLVKFPFEQAYINQRALGFGGFKLRGLELYIIDGVAAFNGKYTLSKKVLSFKIPMPFKIKELPYIPFAFFVKAYTDVGYSYIPQQYTTKLNNRFLYTGGIGLDILSLYDLVFKIEYSFNQLGENGVFLQGGGGN
jgi:outer membrane protein assembly factor BamA